jgi:Arc/MetJ-type ribon-helix-helix transcriptional regulator
MNQTITVNLSMPAAMYADIKSTVIRYRFGSISELVRAAIRSWVYPKQKLTINGFTPEFEKEVLAAANEPEENLIEWDGVTPFTEFVLSHPPKNIRKHAKN